MYMVMEGKWDAILSKLNSDNHYSEVQLEQIKYSLQVILGDISKFLILFLLFTLAGHSMGFLYAYLASMFLRIFVGGNHLKTYLGCLLFSLVYFTVLILVSICLPYGFYDHLLAVSILASIILLIIAPRVSSKSGRRFKLKRTRVKALIFILTTLYILLFGIIKEPIYAIGPFTILFQTIQLLLMKGGYYNEIRTETKDAA